MAFDPKAFVGAGEQKSFDPRAFIGVTETPTNPILNQVLSSTNQFTDVTDEEFNRGLYKTYMERKTGQPLEFSVLDEQVKNNYGTYSSAIQSLRDTHSVSPLGETRKTMSVNRDSGFRVGDLFRLPAGKINESVSGGMAGLVQAEAGGRRFAAKGYKRFLEATGREDFAQQFDVYEQNLYEFKIDIANEMRKTGQQNKEFWTKGVAQSVKQSFVGQAVEGLGEIPMLVFYAIPPVGLAATAGRYYNEGFEESKTAGFDDEKAHKVAVGYTSVFGSIGVLVDKFTLGVGNKAFKGMQAGTIGKTIVKQGGLAVVHGTKAGLTEFVTETAESAALQKVTTGDVNWKQAGTEGALAFITGTVGGSGAGVTRITDAVKTANKIEALGFTKEKALEVANNLISAETKEEVDAIVFDAVVTPILEGAGVAESTAGDVVNGVEEQVAPTAEQNTAEQILYRETNIQNAISLLPNTRTNADSPFGGDLFYFSDIKDLAIGQGENTGVVLEFKNDFGAKKDMSKPSSDIINGSEYTAKIKPSILKNSLKSITIKKAAKSDSISKKRISIFLDELIKTGKATKQILDDGSIKYEIIQTNDTRKTAQQPAEAATVDQAEQTMVAELEQSLNRTYTKDEAKEISKIFPNEKIIDQLIAPSEQRELFKKMLRGDEAARKQFNQNNEGVEEEAPVSEKLTTATQEPKIKIPEPTGFMTEPESMDDLPNITRSKSRVMNKIMTPFIEVVGNISPSIKAGVTRWEFATHQRKKAYFEQASFALEKMYELMKNDSPTYTQVQIDLKNGDFDSAEKVLGKEVVDAIRKHTNILANDLNSVGYEFPRMENYFPRKVKDLRGLRDALGVEERTMIDNAIAEQQKKADAAGYTLSDMEIEKIINNVLTGSYRPAGARTPSSTKKRTIQEVTQELDQYYYDAIDSLIMHSNEVADIVELRRFLGKDIKISGDVVDMNESIGKIVQNIKESEGLSNEDEAKLRGALTARLGYRATGKGIQAYKSLVAFTTLGQLTSSLTQIGDFTWSFYENGLFDTLGGASDVVSGSGITMRDLGIDAISEDLSSPKGLFSAVDTLFKYSGLKAMDKLGKETLVNAALREYQASAKSGKFSTDKQNKLDVLFGAEQQSVINDLKSGEMTEDVKLLLFSTVLDWHPTTLSNMPIAYLENPNGRVLYTLKTFTVKQLDNFRRVAIDDLIEGISTKNMSLASHGFGKLMKLAAIMLACNIPIDLLKDWLTGKKVDLSESTVDNFFKLIGLSRYTTEKLLRKGQRPTEIFWKVFLPPAPFIDMPADDVKYAIEQLSNGEDVDMMNLESWQMLPFAGRAFYWRYGKGVEKLEKLEKQERSSSGSKKETPEQRRRRLSRL